MQLPWLVQVAGIGRRWERMEWLSRWGTRLIVAGVVAVSFAEAWRSTPDPKLAKKTPLRDAAGAEGEAMTSTEWKPGARGWFLLVFVAVVTAGLLYELVPASHILVGGQALLFLGVATALAASLRDYRDTRERMTDLGLIISYAGASGVLLGSVAGNSWDWPDCTVVGVVLLTVFFILRRKRAVKRFLRHVKVNSEHGPQHEPHGA